MVEPSTRLLFEGGVQMLLADPPVDGRNQEHVKGKKGLGEAE